MASKKITVENVTNSKLPDSVNPSKTEKNLVAAKKNGFNNLFNMAKKTRSPEKLKSSFREEDKKDFLKETDSTKRNESLMEKDKIEEAEKEKDFMEKDKDSAVKKVSPKSNSVKRENLDNFFGKLTSPPKSTKVTLPEKTKNDKVKKELTEERKKAGEKQNSRGRKRNRSKETNDAHKKRKRIIVQNDSSDSEVQSDEEIMDSIPEPEPEVLARSKSPSPPRIKHEDGKRKVLKLVNRTYKEGEYIVTKKEHIYVSCSEDDEEEKKEEKTRREQKKIDAKIEKVKKKQSTLTDFFKKS